MDAQSTTQYYRAASSNDRGIGPEPERLVQVMDDCWREGHERAHMTETDSVGSDRSVARRPKFAPPTGIAHHVGGQLVQERNKGRM